MSEFLAWLQRRSKYAEERLAQMVPITPPSTPLMEMLRRKVASERAPSTPDRDRDE